MIPKSGYRFSEKIMLKQKDKAKCRINLSPFRFGGGRTLIATKRAWRSGASAASPMIGRNSGAVQTKRSYFGACRRVRKDAFH